MPLPPLPITLQELGGSKRIVFLSGVDLPHKAAPLGFGTEVEGSTTKYPGSRKPTSQVWTVGEAEIQFAGTFEDRRRGIPGWAISQAFLLDDIAKAAHHIEIIYGPWRRICRWKAFHFTPIELPIIHYEIQLEALHDGLGDTSRIKTGILSLPSIAGALNKLALAQDALNLIQGDFLGPLLGPIKGAVDSVVESVREVGQSINLIARTPGSNQQSQGADLMDRVDSASLDIANALQTLRQVAPDENDGDEFDQAAVRMNLGQSARYLIQSHTELRSLRARLEPLAHRTSDAEAYIVAGGETLERIAASRYGDHRLARDILHANRRLRWNLDAGTILSLRGAPIRSKQRGSLSG